MVRNGGDAGSSKNRGVMMDRRRFLGVGAAGAGGLLVGAPQVAGCSPRHVLLEAVADVTRQAPPPITEAERAERRRRAQTLMAERGLGAIFIEPGTSLLYFAGVRWGQSQRVFGLLLPREGPGTIVCPAFERQRAETRVAGRFEIRIWEEDHDPARLIATMLAERGVANETFGFDRDGRYFIADRLAAAAPQLRIVSAEPVIHGVRSIKSAHELDILRFANRLTLDVIRTAFATLTPGMTQAQLAANVQEAFTRAGYGAGVWVLPLIGESSAFPHGAEQPRPLAQGDIVLLDTGTEVHGYQSDVTRTTALGEPDAEAARVFDLVRQAQCAALAAARPGITAGSLDDLARRIITDGGYGPDYAYFTHRLGHGIGMDGHEWPYLVRGSEVVLRAGMTFSNEPGIYQYGKFGVRLEDIMVITETGAELLTPPAESLFAIG
jgi:Xaa-Pro dipeptidase